MAGSRVSCAARLLLLTLVLVESEEAFEAKVEVEVAQVSTGMSSFVLMPSPARAPSCF